MEDKSCCNCHHERVCGKKTDAVSYALNLLLMVAPGNDVGERAMNCAAKHCVHYERSE